MLEKQQMGTVMTIEQGLELISDTVPPIGIEEISYLESVHRVLAEPVYSDINFPPFDRSTMDGYACRKADLKMPLEVIEEIPAGKSPSKVIGEGQCSKIMTGAEIPMGADMVIIKEDVKILEDQKILFAHEHSSTNISFQGEDVRIGEQLLGEGLILRPEHLALLAGVGKTKIKVYVRPLVGILTTGSELIGADQIPGKGQIRNSNGPQLMGQLRTLGIEGSFMGIVQDSIEEIKQKILRGLDQHDLIVISGGISVGDYDFVPEILQEIGFEFFFSKLSAKPGRHTILACKENKYILGLPGNPVSAFVQFEIMGKALIYKLQGAEYRPLKFSVKLSGYYERDKDNRSEFLPVKINSRGEAEFLPYHGSAHIQAVASADALMEIPLGIKRINKGEEVYVRPL